MTEIETTPEEWAALRKVAEEYARPPVCIMEVDPREVLWLMDQLGRVAAADKQLAELQRADSGYQHLVAQLTAARAILAEARKLADGWLEYNEPAGETLEQVLDGNKL